MKLCTSLHLPKRIPKLFTLSKTQVPIFFNITLSSNTLFFRLMANDKCTPQNPNVDTLESVMRSAHKHDHLNPVLFLLQHLQHICGDHNASHFMFQHKLGPCQGQWHDKLKFLANILCALKCMYIL